MQKDKRIALFFSYKVSLAIWKKAGMLSRESKVNNLLSGHFLQTYFISYGDSAENSLISYFPSSILLNNKWRLHSVLYSLLLPFLYMKELKGADIYKVNQLSGAFPALMSKVLYRKKLIVRCGYQLALFFRKQKESAIKVLLAFILERLAYLLSDIIIVASNEDKAYITSRHAIKSSKIEVIPNGIDTESFTILQDVHKERGRILFVGRLVKQKNLFSLIEAISTIKKAHLVIIGQGHLKNELLRKAEDEKMPVTFIDRINNKDLPIEYNRSEIFILPSFFEGNPKVLMEAMACGAAVIGTDVEGINTIIKDKVNGLLCKVNTESIASSVAHLLAENALRDSLSSQARKYIKDNFDLPKMIEKEAETIKGILT